MSPLPVTLQISLAPSDYGHASALLAHQLRVWQRQVAEVLITVDFHRSSGRFSTRWEAGKDRILPLARSFPGTRVLEVDYGTEARAGVAQEFFDDQGPVPAKDYRGGPYYAYFFALHSATHDHVLHMDSDMFFGGGSAAWLGEALTEMESNPKILLCAPLPGPPAGDGRLRSQHSTPVAGRMHTHDFPDMSTRLFLISRSRFRREVGALHPDLPGLKPILQALVEGNPPRDLPEHLFTRAMGRSGLVRREFLGPHPGMWHVHAPYRCEAFYKALPGLITRIESGDIPENQKGDHDINDSMVDWTEARLLLKSNRWWKRWAARFIPRPPT